MTSSPVPSWKGSPLAELGHQTVWAALDKVAEHVPDKLAVVDGERRWSYRETFLRSQRLAQGVAALGLKKGDVAAIYMKNSIELVTIFYALQKLGVVVAWINPIYREQEASFILKDSGARCVFVFEEGQDFNYVNSLTHLASEVPTLETVVAVPTSSGGLPAQDPRVLPLDRLLQAEPSVAHTTASVDPDDLSMLVYTSGTTGRPKGAMSTQSQIVRAARVYSLGVDASEEDVFIGFLPMTHSYGCGAVLAQPFLLGATVVLMDGFSPEKALRLIEQEQVTVQFGAPAHYILELKALSRGRYDIRSLRAGLIAGQIAPAGLIRQIQEQMDVYVASFLGSSETGASIMFPYKEPLSLREKYIGIPVPETQAKVVDPISGGGVAPGEPGELLLSGWHVMKGYWKNPEETTRQIRGDWLHTGDLVARDDNGCLRILGRLKECVNRGGFKIIPSELEALLIENPKIAEVCVVGTPNPVLGESVCACVRLGDPCQSITLSEVREYLRDRVAEFKLPDELLVLDDFPRLSGGLKVKRFGPGGVSGLAADAPDKQTRHG